MSGVTIVGGKEAAAKFELMRGAVARWAAGEIGVISDLPYTGVIETGVRAGRPWRRAGPARMFQRGLAEVLPGVPGRMLRTIPKGATAAEAEKKGVREDLVEAIRKYTPRRGGQLQRSIRIRPGNAG